MLINFSICKNALDGFNIPIKGIIHIGAHVCEEKQSYNSNGVDDSNIIWIEGNPNLVQYVKDHGILNIYNALIDEKEESVPFYIADNFQSSSILEMGTHTEHHKNVKYIGYIPLQTITLAHFFEQNSLDISKYNFWNLDIQGVELRALRSAGDLLQYADALYLEINYEEVYKGCSQINEIDAFLLEKGFVRFETVFNYPNGWGDALYIRYPKRT